MRSSFQSQQAHKRRLAGSGVFAGRLASLSRACRRVQDIIGDLERRAEVTSIAQEGMALRQRRLAQYCPGLRREFDQLPGL